MSRTLTLLDRLPGRSTVVRPVLGQLDLVGPVGVYHEDLCVRVPAVMEHDLAPVALERQFGEYLEAGV